jgi:hypothetical protein
VDAGKEALQAYMSYVLSDSNGATFRWQATIHALYTPDLSSRFAQLIGCLLNVSWMRLHSGCEFLFPTDYDSGLIMVPT